MLLPAEIIRAKRNAQALTETDLRRFIKGVASGDVSDAQIAAFTMAVYCHGMSLAEQSAMTLAMRDTGGLLQWPDLNGPVLDKHSTGGVGDLVSIVMAPLLAACGAYVPMISGRGLGHTGGTMDKMESIPGFNTNPDRELFRKTVCETGLAMTGQGDNLAPADGRIYAIRDVTATVDSIPLIVTSILSKKLAEGLDGLVLDIKTGNGAFMRERNSARDLAASLVEVAGLAGLPCKALITDMNQPLAHNAGNALEIREAIDFLTGRNRDPRLEEVVLSLSSELMVLGGLASKPGEALENLHVALDGGAAAEHFARMVVRQGGPSDLLQNPTKYLESAPFIKEFEAPVAGCIAYIDTRAVGMCVVSLGGGRIHDGDSIDHRVGLSGLCNVGATVSKGEPIVEIHAKDQTAWEEAAEALTSAISIGRRTDPLPALYERI